MTDDRPSPLDTAPALHTPGPWTIEEYGDDDAPTLVIHKDGETRICFMATPGSHGDPAKIEANARLIAAAPDMLAALAEIHQAILFDDNILSHHRAFGDVRVAIAKAIGFSHHENERFDDVRDRLNAAIAKARGNSQ